MQFVSLIHVWMVVIASEMVMTLSASALQGTEDVSATLVNTAPCTVVLFLPVQYMHHHNSNADCVWYIS